MLVPAIQLSESADSLLVAICLPISPLSWALSYMSLFLSENLCFSLLTHSASLMHSICSLPLWKLPLLGISDLFLWVSYSLLPSYSGVFHGISSSSHFPGEGVCQHSGLLFCVCSSESSSFSSFSCHLCTETLQDGGIFHHVPLPRAPVPSLFTVVHKTFPSYTFLAVASNLAGSRNYPFPVCWDQLVLSPLTFRSVIRTCLSHAFDWPVSLSPDPGSKLCSHLLQNVSPFWVLFTTLTSSSPYLTASQPLICVFPTSLHPIHPSRLPWTSWHLLPCWSLSASLGPTPFRLQ